MLEALNSWFMSLSEDYGVNPYIFGAIYVGAIPFFLANMGWLVRRLRQGKSVTLQVLIAGSGCLRALVNLSENPLPNRRTGRSRLIEASRSFWRLNA
jgi:hypothetical protein